MFEIIIKDIEGCDQVKLVEFIGELTALESSEVSKKLLPLIDKGHVNNVYYFVMEYIEGTDLVHLISSSSLTLIQKLDFIVQICKGLGYAHKNNIIHRDIKPKYSC